MGGAFYIVLNMGITSALMGLAVLLARPAFRRAPAARYALWALVGLRLALPVSLPSIASFYNLFGPYVLSVPAGESGASMMNAVQAANAYFPMHYKTGLLEKWFGAAGWAWLIGVLLTAAICTALYLLAAARLRRASPVEDGGLLAQCAGATGVRRRVGLYASGEVSSPVVSGIFRPRIVIPTSMARGGEALRYALLHELVHIKRGDNALRLASALLLCVHWFNPFVWLFFTLAGRDMELACDAGVLRRLDRSEHRGYALALANLSAGRQPVLAAAFGHSAVRDRILGIARYRKVTLGAGILAFLGMLALAVVLMTNAAG